jgi:histidinol-phosphate aminotransferase
MRAHELSRRQFAGALGAGLAAVAVEPRLGSLAEASRPRGVPPDAIQLNSNENPYGPSPRALEAMTRAQAVAARYPSASKQDLVDAIAAHHGVEADRVTLGCGSGEILRMVDMAFLGTGRALVVAEPTFEAVLFYARVTPAKVIKLALTEDFRHDLPRMAEACDARTGLVYVCNPNNPTGTVLGDDELGAFLERVPRSATVVVDEAYHHFVEDPRYRSVQDRLGRHDNLILVRTFSKVYGLAGMRLGYAISSKANAETLNKHRTLSNVNAAVVAAGLASLDDEADVARARRQMNDTRRWLCAELQRAGRRFIPSQASFVMIHLGRDVEPVIDAFRKRKILVGRKFPAMGQWLRVSIGTRSEIETFLAALRELVPVRAAA